MSNDWNLGEKERKGIRRKAERAILIGLVYQLQTQEQVEEYLDELEFLAMTAGAVTLKKFVQKLPEPSGDYPGHFR